MSLIHSILLGLIQGVAEFLPISSSGHLAIAEQLLGMEGASEIPGFFDVLLHLGTLIAVFVAYWPEIRDMILEFFRGIGDLVHGTTPTPVPPARRMILLVIVGTLPLFVILPFKDWIEGLSSNLYVVGGALLVTGCLSQRYQGDILKEMPEVDGILGTGSYTEIVPAIEKLLKSRRPKRS